MVESQATEAFPKPIKGLAMIYNPTDEPLQQELTLPLYYTGLSDTALVVEQNDKPVRMKLDRQYCITVRPTVAARSRTWFVIR